MVIDAAIKALDAEQNRLAELPCVPPWEHDTSGEGGPFLLEECHYSGKEGEEYYSSGTYQCKYCYLRTKEKILPLHARRLRGQEQAENVILLLTQVLGYEWGASIDATSAARSSRAETLDGMVADGLPALTAMLVRSDASAAIQEVVKDLVDYEHESDDAPFFTESNLYDLVGKDSARSILSRIRRLAKSVGYKGRTG